MPISRIQFQRYYTVDNNDTNCVQLYINNYGIGQLRGNLAVDEYRKLKIMTKKNIVRK